MLFDKSGFPPGLILESSADPWPFFLQLNRVLTADSAPAALIDELLNVLRSIKEIEAVRVDIPDQNGHLVTMASRGRFADAGGDISRYGNVLSGPFSQGPLGRAWRSGQPEYAADYRNDASLAAWQAPTAGLNWRSSAVIPLLGRGGPHALLQIYSNRRGFFPNTWPPEMLRQLASVIGNALENRQKHLALRRSQQLYETLFNGAGHLLSAGSEKHILRQLCRTLVNSSLFVAATVGRVDKNGVYQHHAAVARRHAAALRDAAASHHERDEDVPLTLLALRENKTVVSNRYGTDPRFAAIQDLAHKVGYKSVAGMPIARAGACWAILGVMAAEEDAFDDDLIRLLERLASMLGHALDELDLKAALRLERERQSRMARHDTLTKLPNRLAFQEQLAAAMARPATTARAIGMLDLDDFKQINDSWGHGAGDAVLRIIGRRLRGVARKGEIVARLGGDEFALIIAAPHGAADIGVFCRRLQQAVSAPLTLPNGTVLVVSLSAGFTLFPGDDAAGDLLMRHADIALYEAKSEKFSSEVFWRIHSDPVDGAIGPSRCRALLQGGALRLHFQPVLNLRKGDVTAVEALARLQDGETLLAPATFLPNLALDDRIRLFQLVLDAGLRQVRLWEDEGMVLNISVNVDARVLLRRDTMPYITETLTRYDIAPTRLVLEILETHDFLDITAAKARLEEIRADGIRLALDDVGTGYSSILKIRELPLDVVKLDRAFVAGLRETPDDLMFVSVIQTLTASLGMELIVEGVESDDVLDALRMIGAGRAQGYEIARPMDGPALTEWLRAYKPVPAAKEPSTLLGAYAFHSNWIRAFEFWRAHAPMQHYLREHNPFSLDIFFAGQELAPARDAYETLQTLLKFRGTDRQLILQADDHFRGKLIAALKG